MIEVQYSRSIWPNEVRGLISAYGTAIGAGVLFLPINAGYGGIWPLVFMTIIIGPLVYLGHQGLMRFCLSSTNPDGDINDAVTEHMGPKAALAIMLVYFACIYPAVVAYGIGLTNTVNSIVQYQLGWEEIPRSLLSFIMVAGPILVVVAGEKLVLKLCELLVYPLIFMLFAVSVYLIPHWNFSQFSSIELTPQLFLKSVLMTIPVLIFSFNHSPVISTFAQSYRRKLGEKAELQARKVCLRATYVLISFVMFFTFSSVLSLTPDQLMAAKESNIPVLSVFGQGEHGVMFAWLAQIVALLAITSSFFGHFLGAREGLNGLIMRAVGDKPEASQKLTLSKLNRISTVIIALTAWLLTYLNPSIMDMIGTIMAPGFALLLFVLPFYGLYKIDSMAKYRSSWYFFSFFMGLVAIFGYVASQLM